MASTIKLGTIVTWTAPKEPVELSTLRAALADCGFNADRLAQDMAPRNAFTRAVKDLSQDRIIRRIGGEGELLTFQFTREALVCAELEYTKECILELNKETGEVTCAEPTAEAQAIAKHAGELIAQHSMVRISSDITRLVQKIFDDRGGDLVPLRPQGGVYFVPPHQYDLVEDVSCMLRLIGGELNTLSVGDDAASRETVACQMATYFLDMIAQFKDSVSYLTADSSNSIVERRTDAADSIRTKLEHSRDLFSGYVDKIDAELRSAEDAMIEAIRRESVGV